MAASGRSSITRAKVQDTLRLAANPEERLHFFDAKLEVGDLTERAGPRDGHMKIVDIKAYADPSFPLPQDLDVRLGVGRMVKRDTVIVKVVTESGLVGWGESHHGRHRARSAHFLSARR